MTRVVIADDHDVVLVGLTRLLKENGYEILKVFRNGFELLKEIDEHLPDIIILDYKMPGMNIHQVNEIGKRFKTVILTGVSETDTLRSLAESRCSALLTKEADQSEILFCLRTVLNGKKYITPDIVSMLFEPKNQSNGDLQRLSEREIEVLRLISEGYSNKQIAKMLNISSRTVDSHRSNILKKLKVRNNQDLVKIALRHKLISLN
ncbi:MAG: response regulator transcription factor [Deltaproteobacteria bacterium]|nr:response regulator transcription factor [Deltaproteobacteria bacterium]MCX7952457.1 response regulator transcription factor [Deltaproteobacteria bacterium]